MLPMSRLLSSNQARTARLERTSAMIGFELAEDQVAAQKWAREFAEKEIRPVAPGYDESEDFPWPVVKKAAEVGLYGLDFYKMIGEDDSGILQPLIVEELCWGCAGISLAIFGSGLPLVALMASGTPDQVATWAPRMFGTAEDPKVAAFAVTEPGAGSDVSSPRTPGLRQGKKEKKLGIRASHTAEVLLTDCRLPAACLLGGEERLNAKLGAARSPEARSPEAREAPRNKDQRRTSSGALKTFEATRPIVAAQAVGIARAAFEFARDYARERTQFGKPIAAQQAIAFKLADMATEIDAARLLVWRASWMARNGAPFAHAEGSMSKLKAEEVAVRVTDEAIQVLGGYGYIRDFPVEKWHRDSKIYTLFEGTSEIQRLVISRANGGLA